MVKSDPQRQADEIIDLADECAALRDASAGAADYRGGLKLNLTRSRSG
jgi:hypothetical protein